MMRQIKITAGITNRKGEGLDQYLSDISRIPMVGLDEEEKLAYESRQGGKRGKQAKDKLVMANLRFVVSVAKQYQHKGLPLSDLINEGNIGLVKAAEKFDETRGFKFISYAVWWIRQSILQAIAEQGRMVRLPLNQSENLTKINGIIEHFEQENGRKPTAEELSEITNIDLEKIDRTMNADLRHASIDAPFGDEDDSNSLADTLQSDDHTVNDAIDRDSMNKDLDLIFAKVLKPREATILRKNFGLGCQEEGTEEIARQLGLTRERVRQIREKSIVKIRQSGYASLLTQYLGK